MRDYERSQIGGAATSKDRKVASANTGKTIELPTSSGAILSLWAYAQYKIHEDRCSLKYMKIIL